jgi:DNA helicase HerA-like ATPase
VAIDEAHLFFEHEHLTKEIIEFVAQLRKDYRVYLLLMSQQPGRFHPDILALSDVIICYRIESDTELDYLKKNKPAFSDVIKDIKKLKTGEGKAFLWARVSTDDVLDKPRLISVRPKVTEDRGKTATAF